jgi:protein gp37
MAKNSSIEWTHHTFNPWWGCTRVSPGCKHCYAETFAHRIGEDIWGPKAKRRFFGDTHWREPLKWNAEALKGGTRRRVFCASMADVFENRAELSPIRERLWQLIADTPKLDWLLLTKRPERVSKSVPWNGDWPANIWVGVTTENQHWAQRRVPLLLDLPVLGPLDLARWLSGPNRIDWVIAGGESGHHARPMNPDWARQLRDQCRAAAVPFHFKQWGHWRPDYQSASTTRRRVLVEGSKGQAITLVRLGKHAAGRELDGRTWDELPRRQTEKRLA